MPELPEVETTRAGIAPHIDGKTISKLDVRQAQLRWPIPDDLPQLVKNQNVLAVRRRAKYLLIDIGKSKVKGTLIIHLGMSGSLRVIKGVAPEPLKHEHFDLVFSKDLMLRFTDPRRFGACLWQDAQAEANPFLDHFGPEPLSDDFTGEYLFEKSRKRTSAIKTFIMDQKIVVGVGNIYASESLFLSGINPKKAAGKISAAKYDQLVTSIKQVLAKAISEGGTTLKDFVGSDGKPGYFAQQLNVYGRKDEPCPSCQTPIKQITQGQRSTFYCSQCQK
ncbi:MAG: bifunctional DNA-formamidopyrimidine glycosylase/DNA-(apurinic or apyrimidinic site) lyase [Gammaproteobacteria bacterium]|nr:bifunctional DNA-formamidopyrimidine glycosylase/DNA-(apurinic or apyrimidinic site) lyase [Gammaproteobacteria bacterium]